MFIIYICIFFIGASIASFFNATAYRVDNGYKYPNIITKGSHCEKCKKQLTWIELVPIFGYIYIKGKCPKCKTKINIYYPISELVLGITTLLFYIYEITWISWILLIILFILSYHDVKYKAVPKNLVHIFLSVSVIFFLLFSLNIQNIYLPILLSGVLFIINMVKKSFGIGDILVFLALGILLSPSQFFVLFWLSIVTALLYSIIYCLMYRKNIKKLKIPMIPFVSIAYILTLLYGETIWKLLLKYLSI